MRRNNLLTKTDSYKLGHFNMLVPGTQRVHSYYQSRVGAQFNTTVFAGLQYILKEYLVGQVVTQEKIEFAAELNKAHLGANAPFNRPMWERIIRMFGGRLPLRIKAIPEGTPIPVDNVLMTVENLDDRTGPDSTAALTNALETILSHVWYPSTVATLSRETFKLIKKYLVATEGNPNALPFMLHDFGYRSATCDEAAGVGGFGHLINGLGTDTVAALEIAHDYYGAPLNSIAYSVPATEHSVMTARGPNGEAVILDALLNKYPEGILSCVADSFNVYNFVEGYVCGQFKERILARKPDANGNCAFVIRPDSNTKIHPQPDQQVVWILERLWQNFGGTVTPKGFKVLDKHVRVLWGDGIDKSGIETILCSAMLAGFSAENLVFGMGGGLLQKINRDNQRFAFKCNAQKYDDTWNDVYKDTIDPSKRSKRGRHKLIRAIGAHGTVWQTVPVDFYKDRQDELVTVFENGELLKNYSLADLRSNAAL